MQAKLIYFLLGVFIAAVAVHSSPINDEMNNAKIECLKEFDLTGEAAKHIMDSAKPADVQKAKCLKTCLMKKVGYIVNGKVNLEKLMSMDKGITESEKAMYKECADKQQASTDECETFDSFAICMDAAGKAARSRKMP